MICPHCKIAFMDDHRRTFKVEEFTDESYYLIARICPVCKQIIVELSHERMRPQTFQEFLGRALTSKLLPGQEPRPFRDWTKLVWPRGVARNPVPAEVPGEYAKDYEEAGLVLAAGSANASAALSRRCLQNILRHKLGVTGTNLFAEIEEVVNDPTTHSEVRDSLHYLRELGNFAAHPEKSNNAGAIVDVEEDEAEWCLDVIEMLYEIYFVRPAKEAVMRDILDAKMARNTRKLP